MLEVKHLVKSFGGVKATRDVSIDFPTGSLTAIIGPNGAGKTTFFNLTSGHIRPDGGQVLFNGADIVGLSSLETVRRGIGRAFQVASLFPSLTVREALAAAVTSHRRHSWQVLARFPPDGVGHRVDEVMALLDLAPKAGVLSRNLSHGDQKLLDIGLAIAKVHRLWEAKRMTVLFIEHDMDIVFKIAQTVHVLKYGAVLAQGTPDQIRRNQDVIDAYLGTDHRLSHTLEQA